MAYNVTVIDTEENTTTIEVEGDDYILDKMEEEGIDAPYSCSCLLYTSPSPRDLRASRMPSSA